MNLDNYYMRFFERTLWKDFTRAVHENEAVVLEFAACGWRGRESQQKQLLTS